VFWLLRRCRGGHVKSVKQVREKVKDAVKDVATTSRDGDRSPSVPPPA
jgi:hypothetical protein